MTSCRNPNGQFLTSGKRKVYTLGLEREGTYQNVLHVVVEGFLVVEPLLELVLVVGADTGVAHELNYKAGEQPSYLIVASNFVIQEIPEKPWEKPPGGGKNLIFMK